MNLKNFFLEIGLMVLLMVFLIPVLSAAGAQTAPAFDWEQASWDEITVQARGTQVNFAMWSGSQAINEWIDNVVAPRLLDLYGLTLNRIPADAPVFVNRLATEKQQNRTRGSFDLLWINGENFKRAYQAGTIAGPITQKLPNFLNYVDPATAEFDFGFPTMGYEAPYGRAQFVLEYDSASTEPPVSYAQLPQWVREHPGYFTYPEPSDFTGSAFIRQAFIAVTGGAQQYLQGWDPDLYQSQSPKLWDYLNDLKPYLWQQGRSYPRELSFLDGLFERGEVKINMTYTQGQTQARILQGRYPGTARSFVMEDASLFNTHFTAMPFNAPNRAGALVLANYLLSPEAQLSKNDPANWGDFTVLDMQRLQPADRRAFEQLDLGPATLDFATLEAAAVPELPSEYLEALQADWYRYVLGQ